jgi:hypothetical protein
VIGQRVAGGASFGFRVVGEQQAPDGGPVIWFMQTPPAPSSAAIPAS